MISVVDVMSSTTHHTSFDVMKKKTDETMQQGVNADRGALNKMLIF